MSALIDTSILIDHLRGTQAAHELLQTWRRTGPLHASEMSRLEVLAGMRGSEEGATYRLLSGLRWHPVDEAVAEKAGELGRTWLPSHHPMDAADLAIAATTELLDATLQTLNVRHFPMIDGLQRPY